jgi:hypothetical protein
VSETETTFQQHAGTKPTPARGWGRTQIPKRRFTLPTLRERYSYAVIERVSLDELVRVGEPVGVFSWVPPLYWHRPAGRRCTRCKEVLPFSAFRPNLKLKSGWNSWCRGCCAESSRQWRQAHPEQNERRRIPPTKLKCAECGEGFEGRRDRVVCSRRCKDRRYGRLHPEELREKQRRKYQRRKAA